MNNLTIFIPSITAVIAAIWGIYVYSKQQRFKRLQNLNQILQRFGDNDDFMEIFDLFDQNSIEAIRLFSSKSKMKFLVLLEEVALYSTYSEVDKQYAIHVFQWHFYYVYNKLETSNAFWDNIGGRSEIDMHYWKYQRDFARYCNPI